MTDPTQGDMPPTLDEVHRRGPEPPTLPPAQPAQALPEDRPRVPGYEVFGELGRGGMGVVYKARQLTLNRVVALKMILAGAHASGQDLARFRLEAEAVARLHHPNIVQIYQVGEDGGRPYFALEYVDGGSLAQHLDGTPLPVRAAALLVSQLARAMHAAHQAGVVHRDLKPGNILLASGGREPPEPSSGGSRPPLAGFEPKIADFGLAKQLDADSKVRTRSGAIMGTPAYMAPEQAAGKTHDVGPPADIYALGAILYECLTGRPPFSGETPLDTLTQVLECEPAPPRLLNPNVGRDPETICLKCLEKDPAQRYPSAGAVADDLERFLRGESISVRSVNVLDRLARTLERSHLDAEFHSWGTLLLLWAGIVLVTHLASFAIILAGGTRGMNWLCYAGQFAGMGAAYAWQRRGAPRRPAGAAEQQLWSLWLGYVVACLSIPAVTLQLPHFEDPVLSWASYPVSALLTGLAFFSLGSSYWGRCYAIGVAFFVLAVLMPLHLTWASLEFGLLWTAALVAIGLHLRRLGVQAGRVREGRPENRPSGDSGSTDPTRREQPSGG